MAVMEITTKIGCPVSCVYCPQEKFIRTYTERSNILQLSFDVFKTCVDKIPPNVEIIFAGMSEPFLNPDCTKMVLYAHKGGHKISIDTTLFGMNLSDIDSLESVPFKYFFIHLPSGEGYEKIKIDEDYFEILDRLTKSKIRVSFHFHGETVHPKVKLLIPENILHTFTSTRAGNVKIKDRSSPERLKGVIGCRRDLRWNVLLPNGDVILCSMDYSMQHLLGNLISSDYDSLFCGEEFLKIKEGLRNESLDILCRYCDLYFYNVGLWAKLYNSYDSFINIFRKELLRFAQKDL